MFFMFFYCFVLVRLFEVALELGRTQSGEARYWPLCRNRRIYLEVGRQLACHHCVGHAEMRP
jgi:hypothetical protein